MERLTNANHKEIGFYSYCGPRNPFETPLTIGEIAGFITDYSPRKILEDILARLAVYEDTGLMPEEIDALQKREQGLTELLVNISCGCTVTYTRLAELAQAEKDGRLVVLPCKPGQTIWVESCIRGRVTDIATPDIAWIIENKERFGNEIFLNREEAEVAMKKREETI